MTKSKQSLSKTVNLRDISNAISPSGAVLTFAFCLLFFIFVLQPTTYNTEYTFELTQQIAMTSVLAYQFSCWGIEKSLTVMAGLIIGICQFEFLHKKAYLTTLLSFGVKREKLFKHRVLIPLVTAIVAIIVTELIALGINISILGVKPELPLLFFNNLFTLIKYFLFSYTAAVVACVFTGRTVEAAITALTITEIGYIIIFFIESTVAFALYGNPNENFLEKASPLIALNPIANILDELSPLGDYPTNTIDSISLGASVVWCVICSVVLVILTRYFKNGYKSEKTGFKGIHKVLVAFVSGAISLFIAFVFTYFADMEYYDIYDIKSVYSIFALAVITPFIFTTGIYLILYRNSKKLKTAFIGAGASATFILVVFIICITGVFGTYNKAPEISSIESVSISNPFISFSPNGYDGHFIEIYPKPTKYSFTYTDKETIELLADTHELFSNESEEQFRSGFMIKYTLKNGKTIERYYHHISREAIEKILPIWDSEPIKSVYKEVLFSNNPTFEEISFDYEYWMRTIYLSPIEEYNSENMRLEFVSKYGVVTNILEAKKDILTEKQFISLKNAIYKDYCEIGYKEYFTPTTEYYGTLCFSRFNDPYEISAYKVPVTAAMKNTVAFLEALPFYNELMAKSEIKRMAVVDIKEFIALYTSGYYQYNYHEPYLSGNHDISMNAFNQMPLEELTNKAEMEKILDKAYTHYLLYDSGKLVLVEFENGTYMTYGLPE